MRAIKKVFSWTILLLFVLTGCGNGSQDSTYRVINKSLLSQSYGIGVRSGDDMLCNTLSAAIQVLSANGTAQEIAGQFLSGAELDIVKDETALDNMDIEHRTLFVGVMDKRPPMAYSDSNGNLTGFDVEMARAACGLLGWDIEFRVLEFSAQAELDSGNVDCVWSGLTLTTGIKKALTCSEPYLTYDQVLVTLSSSGYSSFGSLKGESIAVPQDEAAAALLALDESVLPKNADAIEYKDYYECIDALTAGDVKAVMMSNISAQWFAR